MREILFRGKRLDNGEWTEGYLLEQNTPSYNAYVVPHIMIEQDNRHTDILEHEIEEVDPATVGQYTGLTDKNGKRIFEGDILTIARKTDGIGTYYVPTLVSPVHVVVKWDFCGWMWETLCEDKRYLHFPDAWCYFECEVIGNIHDNPELLEVCDD